MWDWISLPAVQVVAGTVIMLAVIYGGFKAIVALRPSTCIGHTNVEQLAQNFEEMRLGGDISDEELRNIRSVLGKTQGRSVADATPRQADKP
jgi:hypothetical protein